MNFKHLEEDLENIIDDLESEFNILKEDGRVKDYRKFLRKLDNVKNQMVEL